MLPKTLIKGYDRSRLRNLLTLFFLALAIPTAVLVWQAYDQLKWEAFHQHRGMAEELTNRIDTRLADLVATADARSFADYGFLIVTGAPSANFVQRSPLSTYPVTEDLPGVLGYFQVDTEGVFSTPLLPADGSDPMQLGIGQGEYMNRLALVQQIQAVLTKNSLVRERPDTSMRRGLATLPAVAESVPEEETEMFEAADNVSRQNAAKESLAQFNSPLTSNASGTTESSAIGGFGDESSTDKDSFDRPQAEPAKQLSSAGETYSQQAFDELNLPRSRATVAVGADADSNEMDDAILDFISTEQRANTIGKVADLKLDAELQKKSEVAERKSVMEQQSAGRRDDIPARTKRREQIALPESVMPAAPEDKPTFANAPAPADLRINTFESEIDPLEFSLLDSGHFVLFRNVWRDGERYIQGSIIEQQAFVDDVIASSFLGTTLSDTSNLLVAYQEDVIRSIGREVQFNSYPNGTTAFNGALLYRNRLTAPLGGLELIFSIRQLPAGPGARVLGWTSIIIAIVFLGGFAALYRLGSSQIRLAKQQQDFVSAVSHELKTPLTSIRMYGEMLKEGWADESKRKQYYEYIHDESERLSRLISNVLQLAQITRNEPQFDLKPVSVGELLSNIESKIANQVDRAGFELEFQRDEATDQATINIDDDCFAQIIINLVDNAIKFSKSAADKKIEINSKLTSDNRITFSVRDYGPGIPRDQMKKIFTLFYRSENELTRETVGTGIGLAIVHQLTVAMSGTIDVVNREPGAEFAISFPAST